MACDSYQVIQHKDHYIVGIFAASNPVLHKSFCSWLNAIMILESITPELHNSIVLVAYVLEQP